MTKTVLKIITIALGLLAIKMAINLFPDKTDRSVIAFCEGFPFEKELNISETFTTDFESYYTIGYSLEHPRSYDNIDSLQPIQTNFEILHNNKPIEIFKDDSFFTEANAEYQLNFKFVNSNSKQNTINICIQTELPGPSYTSLFEREFKWVSWMINGIVLLIAIIAGYLGFKRTHKRHN
ncbi:hypothetical protein [Winogradskyella flava]|uniref:Uncharacterized protein n=1 Tax=Winogradskyella flava TaxID=1884876 RepID=A0A842IP48_9FLAO|nr:hypothetical protein [Winogradskyella flava]MBC2844780.1 hypothetical protein [Winogradskyella flava]